MKLGFCHLGFRVCSARRVWYVTQRPSEEAAAVEGTRAHLKGRRPPRQLNGACTARWGGGPPLCAFIAGSCVQPERRPLLKACPVAMICSWGLVCIPNSIPSSQTGVGCSINKASSTLLPCPSESHLRPEGVRKTARPRDQPCCHTWGMSMDRLIPH